MINADDWPYRSNATEACNEARYRLRNVTRSPPSHAARPHFIRLPLVLSSTGTIELSVCFIVGLGLLQCCLATTATSTYMEHIAHTLPVRMKMNVLASFDAAECAMITGVDDALVDTHCSRCPADGFQIVVVRMECHQMGIVRLLVLKGSCLLA